MGVVDLSVNCPACRATFNPQVVQLEHPARMVGEVFRLPAIWKRNQGEQWFLSHCPAQRCRQPMIIGVDGRGRVLGVYPNPLPKPTDERVPENIRAVLDEAKKCAEVGAWRGCAGLARLAIEMACEQRGAAKGKLFEKINKLRDDGVITKEIADWAHAARWIGNDAVHPQNAEPVEGSDASDALELAEQFLHTLYVVPEIAREQAQKRKKK